MNTRSGVPASRYAEVADAAVASLPTEVARNLAADPVACLSNVFGLSVEFVPGLEAECGVAGRYDADQHQIECDLAASAGRRSFTLLHELGHHIAYDVDTVATFLEQQSSEEAEEDFCDAFAAALLLPEDLVSRFIGREGPTAMTVADLFDASPASREACAVAAAQRLVGAGYVIIADLDGTVRFAARSLVPYRIARDTPQPGSVLARAAQGGRAREDETRLRYRSAQVTDPYAADAVRRGGYVFAVLTRDRPAWVGDLWIPLDESGQTIDVTCTWPSCGNEWRTTARPCTKCGDNWCPKCGRCSCGRAATEMLRCPDCGFSVTASVMTEAGICRDCAD